MTMRAIRKHMELSLFEGEITRAMRDRHPDLSRFYEQVKSYAPGETFFYDLPHAGVYYIISGGGEFTCAGERVFAGTEDIVEFTPGRTGLRVIGDAVLWKVVFWDKRIFRHIRGWPRPPCFRGRR